MSKQGIKDNWDLVEKWTFQGAAIQFYLDDTGEWLDILDSNILWEEDIKYREKPAEPLTLESAQKIVGRVFVYNNPEPIVKEAFRVVYEHEHAEKRKERVPREYLLFIDEKGNVIHRNGTAVGITEAISVIKVIEVIE